MWHAGAVQKICALGGGGGHSFANLPPYDLIKRHFGTFGTLRSPCQSQSSSNRRDPASLGELHCAASNAHVACPFFFFFSFLSCIRCLPKRPKKILLASFDSQTEKERKRERGRATIGCDDPDQKCVCCEKSKFGTMLYCSSAATVSCLSHHRPASSSLAASSFSAAAAAAAAAPLPFACLFPGSFSNPPPLRHPYFLPFFLSFLKFCFGEASVGCICHALLVPLLAACHLLLRPFRHRRRRNRLWHNKRPTPFSPLSSWLRRETERENNLFLLVLLSSHVWTLCSPALPFSQTHPACRRLVPSTFIALSSLLSDQQPLFLSPT